MCPGDLVVVEVKVLIMNHSKLGSHPTEDLSCTSIFGPNFRTLTVFLTMPVYGLVFSVHNFRLTAKDFTPFLSCRAETNYYFHYLFIGRLLS